MQQTPDASAMAENLKELQAQALRLIAFCMGPLGYLWLTADVRPPIGWEAPPAAWAGSLLVLLSAALSYKLRRRFLPLASALLVGGTLGGVACAMMAFQSPYLAFLFVLPVIFASILLSRARVLLTAAVAIACSLFISIRVLGEPGPQVFAVWFPLSLIGLVAFASLLSALSLYTALEWTWSGYERARQNERIASVRQGELRAALKALDEATYRLERTNYMLALARDQAEDARRLKQQFAQTISHELRTPLNLIVGFTELIVQAPEYYGGPLPAAYVRDLGIVHRNACHLQSLINDVLDLARVEASEMAIVPEEVDPEALLRDAVSAARSLVEAHGLALRIEIEPGLPRVWLDPGRIRQVVFNLLSNAARFTEQGWVAISLKRRHDDLLFAVADTGVGIAPDQLPHIFEEFRQVDPGARDAHGGSGLGLPISRRFVELHGGRMWAESRPGSGSTFFFTLPIARERAAAALKPLPRSAAAPAPSCEEPVLLAVTRSTAASGLLTRYLHGCRTVVVEDLEQARNAAGRLLPQAVIIDSTDKDLSAADLRQLAQEWQLPHVPFLACSLPGEESLRRQLAVEGYLAKPVNRQGLLDALRPFGEGVDRVLVIDDDQDFTRLLARLLDNPIRRYQVMSARTAQEGLALVEQYRPDLLLLDLMLPDMKGDQVIRILRADPAHARLPIIVISAQDEVTGIGAVPASLLATRAAGAPPSEVVRWVQGVLDAALHSGQGDRRDGG